MIFATVNDVTSVINIFPQIVKGIDEIEMKSNKIVSNFAVQHYHYMYVAMVTVTSE